MHKKTEAITASHSKGIKYNDEKLNSWHSCPEESEQLVSSLLMTGET